MYRSNLGFLTYEKKKKKEKKRKKSSNVLKNFHQMHIFLKNWNEKKKNLMLKFFFFYK